jgi:hypothetical protein
MDVDGVVAVAEVKVVFPEKGKILCVDMSVAA